MTIILVVSIILVLSAIVATIIIDQKICPFQKPVSKPDVVIMAPDELQCQHQVDAINRYMMGKIRSIVIFVHSNFAATIASVIDIEILRTDQELSPYLFFGLYKQMSFKQPGGSCIWFGDIIYPNRQISNVDDLYISIKEMPFPSIRIKYSILERIDTVERYLLFASQFEKIDDVSLFTKVLVYGFNDSVDDRFIEAALASQCLFLVIITGGIGSVEKIKRQLFK